MPPDAFEEWLGPYLDERLRHAGDPATAQRTVAAVFDRAAPARSRRLLMGVVIAVVAALVVAAPITLFLVNRSHHTTPAPVIHPHPSSTAGSSVPLSGSPGVPALNPTTGTLYVPIQCPTGACSTSSNVVDLINTTKCNAEIASDCRVVTRAMAGVSPQAVAVDVATDTIYVANYFSNSGSVSVLNGALCNATVTRECGRPVASIDVGGVAAVFDPNTKTLYVADPAGGIHVIDGATCNALTTSGCGKTELLADNDGPGAVDVDLATDTVYAVNVGSGNGNTVSVLDGATCNGSSDSGCNAPSPTVTVGSNAIWDAVDQATGTVYVSSFNDGTVSVIDGARCNAGNTSGCASTPVAVPTGPGLGGVAVDDQLHTVFAVSQNDDTLSAINTRTCNGATASGCAQQPPSEQAGTNAGPEYNAFPNSVTILPQTDTAYLVSTGTSNVLAVVSMGRCNATDTSGCRADAPSVPEPEFEALVDAATNTIYASNYNRPEIDVINGATCNAGKRSGCAAVAEIPMPDPMAAMGAIDDVTHTLYVANSFGTSVSVINIATCNAGDAAGCSERPRTIRVGEEPGPPVLNAVTRTLYVPVGTEANEVAVLDAATCNAEITSGCDQNSGHRGRWLGNRIPGSELED